MIAPDLDTAIAALRGLVENAERIVPFTGAGISTESGIPDFRSPGGMWTRNRPIPFDEYVADVEARREAWRRRFNIDATFAAARPTRGHLALASLYRMGKASAVVTQNIDNLHQSSGIAAQDVIELHGNTTYATCLDCGRRHEIAPIRQRFEASGEEPPDCDCGGIIKTATISFGQAMPEEPMRRAQELAAGCDLFVSVGSSLVVWPAAGIPLLAKRNGARLVIINREPTELDEFADLVVRNDIGDVLAPFIGH